MTKQLQNSSQFSFVESESGRDRMFEQALKKIEEGIWDITRGVARILLRHEENGKREIAEGIKDIEEGLDEIEKALTHECLVKDVEALCILRKAVRDIGLALNNLCK